MMIFHQFRDCCHVGCLVSDCLSVHSRRIVTLDIQSRIPSALLDIAKRSWNAFCRLASLARFTFRIHFTPLAWLDSVQFFVLRFSRRGDFLLLGSWSFPRVTLPKFCLKLFRRWQAAGFDKLLPLRTRYLSAFQPKLRNIVIALN